MWKIKLYRPSAVRRYSRTYLLHFVQTFSVLIMEKQCSNSFNLGSPLREFPCIQVSIIRFYLLWASPHVIGPGHMFGKANQRYTLMEENREIKTLTHLMPAAVGKWNQVLMVSTGSFTGTLSNASGIKSLLFSLAAPATNVFTYACMWMVWFSTKITQNTSDTKKRFEIHLKFKMKGMSRERVCSTKLGETEG